MAKMKMSNMHKFVYLVEDYSTNDSKNVLAKYLQLDSN